MEYMVKQFTAIYKKSGKWYLGWVEEIPGVNTQGKTLKEVKENLKEAVLLILETNQMLAKKDFPKGKFIREPISVSLK
jgi:predicted RNase H-like HicB family nuclease